MAMADPHVEPDPNGVGREAALAQALRNLLSFTRERFEFRGTCNCDYCRHVRYANRALMSHGYGERGLAAHSVELEGAGE